MHILVVDHEFLVAMEAERILMDAIDCEVRIATARNYLTEIESQQFEIIVIDSMLVAGERSETLRALCKGLGIVLTTLAEEDMPGIAGWEDVPVVAKPFEDQKLIDAVKNAALG